MQQERPRTSVLKADGRRAALERAPRQLHKRDGGSVQLWGQLVGVPAHHGLDELVGHLRGNALLIHACILHPVNRILSSW